jgi:signal transduction histidine kinase
MRGAVLRDAWLPLLLATLAVVETTVSYPDHPAGTTGLLSTLLPMALVTGARRRSPVVVAVAETVLVAVLVLAVLPSVSEQPALTSFLCLLVALFNLGAHGEGAAYVVATTGVGAALTALQLAGLVAGQAFGDVVPSMIFLAGAFALGRALHRSRGQARSARARAEEAERTRDQHARQAAEAERARIARELHDVVAHALTGIVVQASVEARLQPDAPGVETLRAVERQGREAMVELRRLLGLLREEGQGPADAPLPSLMCVEALVEDLRRAGHPVALDVDGHLAGLPPGVDLAAYRVLQEALTNVARHAPGSATEVRVRRVTDEVVITVENGPGTGARHELDSGGHGLAGMRERVRLYDGRLVARPGRDDGFRVAAHFPLSATPEDAAPLRVAPAAGGPA